MTPEQRRGLRLTLQTIPHHELFKYTDGSVRYLGVKFQAQGKSWIAIGPTWLTELCMDGTGLRYCAEYKYNPVPSSEWILAKYILLKCGRLEMNYQDHLVKMALDDILSKCSPDISYFIKEAGL